MIVIIQQQFSQNKLRSLHLDMLQLLLVEIFWIHDFLLSVFPQQWSLGSVSFLFEQAYLKRRSPQLEVAITLRHPVFCTLGSGKVVVNVVTFPAQSSSGNESTQSA